MFINYKSSCRPSNLSHIKRADLQTKSSVIQCAVTLMSEFVQCSDVHISVVKDSCSELYIASITFSIIWLLRSCSTRFIKYRRDGITYFGWSSEIWSRNPWFSTMDIHVGWRSIAIIVSILQWILCGLVSSMAQEILREIYSYSFGGSLTSFVCSVLYLHSIDIKEFPD